MSPASMYGSSGVTESTFGYRRSNPEPTCLFGFRPGRRRAQLDRPMLGDAGASASGDKTTDDGRRGAGSLPLTG
jgi:hypothetical protein